MNRTAGLLLLVSLGVILVPAVSAQQLEPVAVTVDGSSTKATIGFTAPVRLKDGEHVIRIENPGYAAPCWADVNGDGKKDLLVGQFAGGRIKVYPGLGEGRIGTGEWLHAEGKIAEVPGVW